MKYLNKITPYFFYVTCLYVVVCCIELELSYTVGGTISGLDGTVVIQNNSADNLTLTSNGDFTFATSLLNGESYSVTVLTNPSSPDQTCSVSNGSGIITGAHVTNVSIACSTDNKIIFLKTSGLGTGGNLGGITGAGGADDDCTTDANCPDGSTCKALLVDGTNRVACTSANCATDGNDEHVDWVFQKDTTYVKTDGTTVVGTTDSLGLLEFPLSNKVGSLANNYWTGLEQNWTTGSDCDDWSSNDFIDEGHMGRQNATDATFINVADNQNCRDNGAAVMCVQQ